MNRDELRLLIAKSFANVPHPGADGVGNLQHCAECRGLVSAFQNVTWQTASAKSIDANFDKLPLFFPEAYHHFLPAFLQRSIDAPGGLTWEFTFYSLSSKQKAWFNERTCLFSATQISCLISYLEFQQAQFDELQRWLATEKVMAKRLAYWKDLLKRA